MKNRLIIIIFSAVFLFGGISYAKADTTYTCYNTCSPVYSNWIGRVILDLQCNGGSPSSYTGWLTVNGVTISYLKTCLTPPPTPSVSGATCNATGTQATISWSSPGATYYAIRNDRDSNSWSGTCASINPGDTCEDTAGTSRAFGTTPGNSNFFWVHACNSAGCSAGAAGIGFSCVAPPNPNVTLSAAPNPVNLTLKSDKSGFIATSTTLTWNVTNDAAACGGNCNCIVGGSGVSKVYPANNTQSMPIATSGNHSFSVTCVNSVTGKSGIGNVDVDTTCTPNNWTDSCDKLCGEGQQASHSLNSSCVDNVTYSPCNLGACPAGTTFEEVKL